MCVRFCAFYEDVSSIEKQYMLKYIVMWSRRHGARSILSSAKKIFL